MGSTLPRSRPLGQSLPLGEKSWSLSICMLCRRSFHCDGSLSLRLFVLGLRANKSRLLGPCCLGGSPSRFIDQARGVLLFVFSFSLIFIFCFLICLFSLASGFSLWRGSFLLLMSRDVSSFLLSSLGFCTRVLSALRPSLVRPFEFTCGVLRICSVCCTHAWFVFGCWQTVCSGNPGRGPSIP